MKTQIRKIISEILLNKRYTLYISVSALMVLIGSTSSASRLFLRIYQMKNPSRKYEFAKFAKKHLNKCHSVDYQDLLVLYLFNKSNFEKTFLELGACDGLYKSNSYYLEQNLWGGMAVEANPLYYDALTKNRNMVVKAAVSSQDISSVNLNYEKSHVSGGSILLEHFEKNLVVESISVPVIYIDNLIQMYLKIYPKGATYVSLDIEGGEELLLDKIITKLNPKIISVEHNNDLQKSNALRDIMNLYSYYEVYKGLTRNESIFINL